MTFVYLSSGGEYACTSFQANDCTIFITVVVADTIFLQRTPKHQTNWQVPDPMSQRLRKFDISLRD